MDLSFDNADHGLKSAVCQTQTGIEAIFPALKELIRHGLLVV